MEATNATYSSVQAQPEWYGSGWCQASDKVTRLQKPGFRVKGHSVEAKASPGYPRKAHQVDQVCNWARAGWIVAKEAWAGSWPKSNYSKANPKSSGLIWSTSSGSVEWRKRAVTSPTSPITKQPSIEGPANSASKDESKAEDRRAEPLVAEVRTAEKHHSKGEDIERAEEDCVDEESKRHALRPRQRILQQKGPHHGRRHTRRARFCSKSAQRHPPKSHLVQVVKYYRKL